MADITVELNLVPVPTLADVGYMQSDVEDANDLVKAELPFFGFGAVDADFTFSFDVPDGWDTAQDPTISITSHFNTTTGKYRLQALYVVSAKTVTMDPSAFDETVNITSATGDTVPGTARLGDEASAVLAKANFTKKYVVKGILRRVLSDTTNDTVAVIELIDSPVIYFPAA